MKARYFAVAVTVAMALALLTACGGSGSATHSAPAANSAPARAPGEVEVDQIADFLAGLAKDPAKNFIMEQIGLPTTSSQLKALSNKIDALSNQLAQTETRLSTQIAELSLQGRVDYLQDQATNLRSFTNHYLKPL